MPRQLDTGPGTGPDAPGAETGLGFERHCAEIVTQTRLLRGLLADGADPATPVPSCPGWTIGALVRHLGGGQRWAETVVATRASGPPPDGFFRDVVRDAEPPAAELAGELAAAEPLADALRAAGPDAAVWTPTGSGAMRFWARRFAFETVVHRADATLAAGEPFSLDPDVAVDAVDEWLELGSLPQMLEFHPERRGLLGPGRTVHLHAIDTPGAEWVADLTGAHQAWRRAHERSAVAVRGPVADLLLLVYGRRRVDDGGLEVLGDRGLLDEWLAGVPFR
ncbi:maleylpyruvate isomerase family mycothiol-dependent enzyme [Geodermatophilus sp. SYSU D00708]